MTAPDHVQAATDRAAKRNEGGRHTTPRGLRHEKKNKSPPPREKHVPSAKRPPSPRAEAEMERMGPAGPPLPPEE